MKVYIKLLLLLPVITFGCGDGPPPHIPKTMGACKGTCIIFDHYDCPEYLGNMEKCVSKCEHVAGVGYIWVDDTSGPQCVVKHNSTIEEVRSCNVKCER